MRSPVTLTLQERPARVDDDDDRDDDDMAFDCLRFCGNVSCYVNGMRDTVLFPTVVSLRKVHSRCLFRFCLDWWLFGSITKSISLESRHFCEFNNGRSLIIKYLRKCETVRNLYANGKMIQFSNDYIVKFLIRNIFFENL